MDSCSHGLCSTVVCIYFLKFRYKWTHSCARIICTPTILKAQCVFFGWEDVGFVRKLLQTCGNSLMYLLQRKNILLPVRGSRVVIYDEFYFKKSSVEILYLYCMAAWLGPSPQMNFRKPEVKPPSPLPILLCLSTAIEPQKEEADENYNSVNTRMRKTQVGSLFPEVGHFSKCSIDH